ncbi:MAG: BTAD domain-containing putative transcriptional regulator, partial [Motilibacteraceae bacterium]
MAQMLSAAAPGSGGTAGDRAGLALSVLGELSGSLDGAALDLGGRQQRSVLGVLLVAHGAVVPAERIIDAVYGEQPPPRAAAALQSYVSHLRRRLEPGRTARSRDSVIVSIGAGYALRLPEDAVDAWRFERLIERAHGEADPQVQAGLLREALALWHGPAYMEYAESAWAQPEAVRLTELLEVARERLVAARLACGEAAVVVPDAEQLVAAAPLREERWRLLALALYRSHRQADALAALRRARALLADELGVDPGPALRAVEAEVLAQSPALDVPVALVSNGPVVAASVPAQHTPRPVPHPADALVDRDRELVALRRSLADLAAGTGGVALIEGPAGIGQTRLLAEVRAEAAGDVVVLTARGSQLEREFAFGAVRQLFEPLLVAPERRAALLAGAAGAAAGVFDVSDAASDKRADGSFSVLHGLYWLIVNLATERPVLLAVDDLQWCDAGSLRALAYLVRRREGRPVLLAAPLRTGEPHEDAALLAELAHDPSTTPVRPGPLSREGVDELVRGRLGADAAPAFVEACFRTTGGNPLLLRQMLRALESEGVRPDALHAHTVTAVGSRAVSSLVLMRLSRMPAAATAVARAIAVLGDGAALPALASLAGVPEPETAAAVAALARAEVVRDEHPLGFVHPLVR